MDRHDRKVHVDKLTTLPSIPYPLPFLISDSKNWLPVCSQNDWWTFGALDFTTLRCWVDLAFQASLGLWVMLAALVNKGCCNTFSLHFFECYWTGKTPDNYYYRVLRNLNWFSTAHCIFCYWLFKVFKEGGNGFLCSFKFFFCKKNKTFMTMTNIKYYIIILVKHNVIRL